MIGILGAGAFGTALAVALGRSGRAVRLWARDADQVRAMQATRRNAVALPDVDLPETVSVHAEIAEVVPAEALLLCVPMQALAALLDGHTGIDGSCPLVACCKGVDLTSLRGPVALIRDRRPEAVAAILTGPGFAADIARGLPTALTLAATERGAALQDLLSTQTLRLYRTDDIIGAELGGALKNVVAIAAGVVIGAGLGESARAALLTRGYAEMLRLAMALGARPETLAGLSGLGDLVLTCTSAQSRNFRYGAALGQGTVFDPSVTVEGIATARAVLRLAAGLGIDMPVTAMVDALASGRIALNDAIARLMSRPLKQE
ncbi:NAD(P)H-dependent glycerol-3-phosphate dehydrogenase [Rhodobacter calidifons]|uniref:Glycerol-3-phosphate dehydrogenase [NAD(P)+] n=1 Tax=Rhodobacter calidifons TaxID=2715277 RepID=A0ABX0G4A4_9RHOB|nr:NAD(P)H-dependent glycerol-3-phosphate dehydrogenase [Rhodobacter calidifons]NHB75718.1 NAD(P)-dependent glycerol-3-phosphate dehydrogenase [Rhodobacter calidifons]